MSSAISALIPELQQPAQALFSLAQRAGVNPHITSTLRTRGEQESLYRRFLAGGSKYPAAPPGTSAHEYGFAFDMVVTGAENQNDLGTVWEQWGGVWGGHNRDPIHFEYPGFHEALARGGASVSPVEGGAFYKLVDFLSGFVPYLGEAQLADTLFRIGVGEPGVAEWYLQHPAEAIRDLLSFL